MADTVYQPNSFLTSDPIPSIMGAVAKYATQLSYSLASINTNNDQISIFGTVTASTKFLKPFIIGFIPPSNPVQFIPIERSFSKIGGTVQQSIVANAVKSPSGGTTGGGLTPVDTSGTKAGSGSLAGRQKSVEQLSDDFFTRLIEVAASIGTTPEALLAVLYSESGLYPQAKNPYGGAMGINQVVPSELAKVLKSPQDQYDYPNWTATQQLGVVEQQFLNLKKSLITGKFNESAKLEALKQPIVLYLMNAGLGVPLINPTVDPEMCVLNIPVDVNPGMDKNKDGKITLGDFYKNFQDEHKEPGYQLALERLNQARDNAAVIKESQSQLIVSETTETAEVPETPGLMSYNGFSGPETDIDDKLRARLGRNIRQSNQRLAIVKEQTDALQERINLIRATPPLILLVNPSEFNREYAATIDFGSKSRSNNIVHTWLETPLKLSCSGTTSGQYVVDAEGNGGLTNVNRIHSLSYANLLSLLMIYKNNAIIYTGQEVKGNSGIPIIACSLYIYYDDHIYIGSFDDFSIDDSADKPHNLNYSFRFTARYDNDVTPTGDIVR